MTARPFTPHPYQRLMIDHALDNPRSALWAGMGTGKTLATLSAIDVLTLTSDAPTLVLAPKRVAQSTWPDEAEKWAHLRNIEVVPIVGGLQERKAALRRPATVHTMNYENLPWLVSQVGHKWPWKQIVADESTRLKSFRLRQGGMRARELGRVAHKQASRFLELTATPSPNGLEDLWGQFWFLDRGERLGASFAAFGGKYFNKVQVGNSRHATKLEPRDFALAEISAKCSDLAMALNPKDWFDLRDPIVRDVYVTLPPAARAQYEAMEKEMFLALDTGEEVEAFNAAGKTIKCLQIASGAIYTDEKSTAWREVHDQKIQALESIVAEAAGMPVLVAYHWKHDLERLLKAFKRGRALDDNPQTIRDWNKGKIPILFAHPESAGHGLNLQDGGNILAVFSHWWNLESYQQILERIGPVRQLQAGHNRPVFIYNIVAEGTVDEDVIANREGKRGVQAAVLGSARRRNK